MVPLTDAVIEYPIGGDEQPQRLGTVIVNREQIDRIVRAVERGGRDPGPARVDETKARSPKDFTGAIVDRPARRVLANGAARRYHRRDAGRRRPAARGPLAGIRVIDLSTVLAGPYATMLLGDLGADVVKVEPPDGDATRGWGPPWVGDRRGAGRRTAAYFLAVNRNKRAIRLDLQGARRVGASCAGCWPAPTCSSRTSGPAGSPGSASTTTALETLNPRLVHLAITGYGTDGSRRPTGPATTSSSRPSAG